MSWPLRANISSETNAPRGSDPRGAFVSLLMLARRGPAMSTIAKRYLMRGPNVGMSMGMPRTERSNNRKKTSTRMGITHDVTIIMASASM